LMGMASLVRPAAGSSLATYADAPGLYNVTTATDPNGVATTPTSFSYFSNGLVK
jgi:hypothetical protein